VARLLIQKRELPAERTSLQGMKDWARRHPKKVKKYLDANPSYVFFKVLEANLPGPIGSLGVPLTAERSIAVDPRVIPLGPVYLATTPGRSPSWAQGGASMAGGPISSGIGDGWPRGPHEAVRALRLPKGWRAARHQPERNRVMTLAYWCVSPILPVYATVGIAKWPPL
jgi:membrane-bound lytic murein transglycosylase A